MARDAPLGNHDRTSFVSGHTSATAVGTFFAARVIADCYPESPWRHVAWVLAAALPAATGYYRVRAGRHSVSDVLGGLFVGAASGMAVPTLARRGRVAAGPRLRLVPGTHSVGVGVDC